MHPNDGIQFLTVNKVVFEDRLRTAIDETVIDDNQCAIPAGAVERTLRLVQTLHVDFPIPEVAIDPDGAISLDWVDSMTRIFSISVGDSDSVAYAWINGFDRGSGVVRFEGSLPKC